MLCVLRACSFANTTPNTTTPLNQPTQPPKPLKTQNQNQNQNQNHSTRQCNDSYGAIVVASELAKAFNCTVNDLPLSLDLSWFEQKAVAVLLTLLHLGVKNIRLGPRLPAFLTPEALDVLVQKFNIMPASLDRPEEDLKRMMANR